MSRQLTYKTIDKKIITATFSDTALNLHTLNALRMLEWLEESRRLVAEPTQAELISYQTFCNEFARMETVEGLPFELNAMMSSREECARCYDLWLRQVEAAFTQACENTLAQSLGSVQKKDKS